MLIGDPGRIRTPNPQSRNLIFYPVELRGQRIAKVAIFLPSPTNPIRKDFGFYTSIHLKT